MFVRDGMLFRPIARVGDRLSWRMCRGICMSRRGGV